MLIGINKIKGKAIFSVESQLINVEATIKLEKSNFGSYYSNVLFRQESSKNDELRGVEE